MECIELAYAIAYHSGLVDGTDSTSVMLQKRSRVPLSSSCRHLCTSRYSCHIGGLCVTELGLGTHEAPGAVLYGGHPAWRHQLPSRMCTRANSKLGLRKVSDEDLITSTSAMKTGLFFFFSLIV